jgi:hypothetical protein
LNKTPHTHILVELAHPETRVRILREMSQFVKEGHLDVKAFRSFGQLINYHYGFKDGKEKCTPGPVWKTAFNYDNWLKGRVLHRR